jgi:osmotically-inducible protein OsmY
MKPNSQIKQEVLDALSWDTRVDATHVGVRVENGVVTLTGTVPNYVQRCAAAEAAHPVAGVNDLANDIQVPLSEGAIRSDTDVARAVRRTLQTDVQLPDDQIESTVSRGIVTLDGTVDFWHQIVNAERAVLHQAGVRGVINNLHVDMLPRYAEEICQEIEAALERRADRAAKHIQVTAEDGVVTLSGPVHTWAERQAVLGAARSALGVREVLDQLYVA